MGFLHKLFSHSAEIIVGISAGLVSYNLLTRWQGISDGLRGFKVYELVMLIATVVVAIALGSFFVVLM